MSNKFAIFVQIEELFSQLPLDFQVEAVRVLSESINSGGKKLLPMVVSSTKVSTKTNPGARGRYATVGASYLEYMKSAGKPVSAKMIAEHFNIKTSTAYSQLDRMLHHLKLIKRHSLGKYIPA